MVGVIVAIYYLGCSVGAVIFSMLADRYGRKTGLFTCLATSSLGNLIMFIAGLGYTRGALPVMIVGRIIMGLGVGGVDSVVPVYSSELSSDGARGKALAKEFQSNIFGLNMAFAINLAVTQALGKENQWAWRIPIIAMQIYPLSLMAVTRRLPESPRWLIHHGHEDGAKEALATIYGKEEGENKHRELVESNKKDDNENVGYKDMFTPGHAQFHPTMITVMGQINQALTGYGGKSRGVDTPGGQEANRACSCLRVRSSDLRASRIPGPGIGVPDPRQLHFILSPHDVRLAVGGCGGPKDHFALGIGRPERLFPSAYPLRWARNELLRAWNSSAGCSHTRNRLTVRSHWCFRYRLARHHLAHSH